MNGILTNIPNSKKNNIYRTGNFQLDYAASFKILINFVILKSMFPKFLNHLHQLIMVVIVMNWDVSELTWPIKLLHPSKSRVKASDTFYDELVCFFKDMYDMDVYVNPVFD